MLNYVKSLFIGEVKKVCYLTDGWQKNFNDIVYDNDCSLEILDVPEGKQIVISNWGSGYCTYTIVAVFDEGEPIPGKLTEKDFKFQEFPGGEQNKINQLKLNDEGVIYKVTIHSSQKVELARGKWKDVKFICLDSKSTRCGLISEEIKNVARKENSRNEQGRVKELIEDGHLVEGRPKPGGYLDNNLHFAVENGCFAIAELLISSGFNVNRERKREICNGFGPFATRSYIRGERAIHIAARNGDLEMVKLLANSNADLSTRMSGPDHGFLGETPSDIAYKIGFNEVASFINQEINKKNSSGCLIQ